MSECKLCGKRSRQKDLLGGYCIRCDTLAGDAISDLKQELEGTA